MAADVVYGCVHYKRKCQLVVKISIYLLVSQRFWLNLNKLFALNLSSFTCYPNLMLVLNAISFALISLLNLLKVKNLGLSLNDIFCFFFFGGGGRTKEFSGFKLALLSISKLKVFWIGNTTSSKIIWISSFYANLVDISSKAVSQPLYFVRQGRVFVGKLFNASPELNQCCKKTCNG